MIDGDSIRELYGVVYERREELIDDRVIRLVEGRNDLVWPSVEIEVSDGHIECGRDLPAMERRCTEYCVRLRVAFPVDVLSLHIATNFVLEGFLELSYPANSKYLFPFQVAAVSIYITSHLVGQPVPRRAIQNLISDEYVAVRPLARVDGYIDIRSTYRIVRDECNQFVRDAFRETLGLDLNCQSLEADVGEEGDDSPHGDSEDDDAMPGLERLTG